MTSLLNNLSLFAGDFIGSFWFFVLGAVVLIALIGLLLFLRNRPDDDD